MFDFNSVYFKRHYENWMWQLILLSNNICIMRLFFFDFKTCVFDFKELSAVILKKHTALYHKSKVILPSVKLF